MTYDTSGDIQRFLGDSSTFCLGHSLIDINAHFMFEIPIDYDTSDNMKTFPLNIVLNVVSHDRNLSNSKIQ